MRYILARDIGGTKCSALLVSSDGFIVGSGHCDVGDPASEKSRAGSGRSPETIRQASLRALAGRNCDELYIINGLPDQEHYTDCFGSVHFHYVSESDAVLSIPSYEYGLVVLAGTGAFVHAQTRDGRVAHVDSLGPLLGDYGSGYHIGYLALRAAARSGWHDRYSTSLRVPVYDACGADVNGEFISGFGLVGFSRSDPDRAEIASFTRIVDREARAGDRIANEILKEAAKALSETVRDVVDKLDIGGEDYPMVGTGGVAVNSEIYWQHFTEFTAAIAPNLRPEVCRIPAVVGVALSALKTLGSGDQLSIRKNLLGSFSQL